MATHILNPLLYLKLGRWDSLIGFWLALWPSLIGLILASRGIPPVKLVTIFVLGALVMRSAGCTYNDLVDKKIDSQVRRTQARPLAIGALNSYQAIIFLILQLFIGLVLLLQLNLAAILLGCGVLVLILIYPWMKRITYWPQVFLGLTFNSGLLIGWAAVYDGLNWRVVPWFVAMALWTILYDTIYAHQDLQDDLRIGIKSTAIKFGKYSREALAFLAVGVICCLIIGGVVCDLSSVFFAALVAVAGDLLRQVYWINFNDSASCRKYFLHNKWTGLLIAGSVLLGLF